MAAACCLSGSMLPWCRTSLAHLRAAGCGPLDAGGSPNSVSRRRRGSSQSPTILATYSGCMDPACPAAVPANGAHMVQFLTESSHQGPDPRDLLAANTPASRTARTAPSGLSWLTAGGQSRLERKPALRQPKPQLRAMKLPSPQDALSAQQLSIAWLAAEGLPTVR
jgi:hypothetical protein